jgi:hydrogenase-4 component C
MPNLSMSILAVAQALLLLALAPLMTGLSRMIRARMHSRRGPGILQDYRDLIKLFKRQDVASGASGKVFHAAPYIILSAMVVSAMALPVLTRQAPIGVLADLVTEIYLFALARFFFSLSGIDSGSSFAGIGAVRELTLGVLVEPIMLLSLLVVALCAGTTNIGLIEVAIGDTFLGAPTAISLALIAFGFAVFIEMGKLPFDMAEAEQELQEGPLTEYSGSALGIMKLGMGMKKVVMAQFFLGLALPFGAATVLDAPSLILAVVPLVIKLFILFGLAALIENSMARGRFLLTSRVTLCGFGLAALSFVFYLTGL